MLRVEPRELVAAAAAAVAPAAWAVAGGGHGLDHERGAAFVVSARAVAAWLDGAEVVGLAGGESWIPAAPLPALVAALGDPVALAGALALFAHWLAGYGGWRAARSFGAAPLGAIAVAAAAQLGPWTVFPLASGDVPALAVGATLLGLAHPALAPVLAWWNPAVAAVLTVGSVVRRRWFGALAVLPLGVAAMSAPAAWPGGLQAVAEPAAASTPTYAADRGAWFPLPPSESAAWRTAAASYGGRWVHPLSVAVSGDASAAMPTTALPIAVAQAVVPAPPGPDPDAQLATALPAAARPWGRGLGAGAVASACMATLWALLGWAARGRRTSIGVAVLAAGAVVAGASALRLARPAGGTAPLPGAVLAAAPPADAVFPPPGAPWFSGRWSATQLAAVGRAPAPPEADPALAELARLSGYGLDTRGAERLTAVGRRPLAEAVAALPGGVLIDRDALPGWGWARIVSEAEAGGLLVEGEGTLVVLRAR